MPFGLVCKLFITGILLNIIVLVYAYFYFEYTVGFG